ncbi:MAG: hypothetical protein ACRDQ2_01425 [Gaiellales bacterium]
MLRREHRRDAEVFGGVAQGDAVLGQRPNRIVCDLGAEVILPRQPLRESERFLLTEVECDCDLGQLALLCLGVW